MSSEESELATGKSIDKATTQKTVIGKGKTKAIRGNLRELGEIDTEGKQGEEELEKEPIGGTGGVSLRTAGKGIRWITEGVGELQASKERNNKGASSLALQLIEEKGEAGERKQEEREAGKVGEEAGAKRRAEEGAKGKKRTAKGTDEGIRKKRRETKNES